MAREYRAKGANLMNAPVVGPLGRVVTGGRNWESFTNDPFLDGQLGAATIQAAQEAGVITSTKHFIVTEV
jgi:beta-glucosidase